MGVLNRYEDRGYTSERVMDENMKGRAGVDWGLQKTEKLRTEIFTCRSD